MIGVIVVGVVVEVMRMVWFVERSVWLLWWEDGGSEAVVRERCLWWRLLRATLVVVWLWLMVEAIVVVVMVAWLALWLRGLLCGWSKITIVKEKHYLKDHSPDNTNNSL